MTPGSQLSASLHFKSYPLLPFFTPPDIIPSTSLPQPQSDDSLIESIQHDVNDDLNPEFRDGFVGAGYR
ncbi:hypothetical protein HDU76_011940, partial [Blyttiomyces sp. JEL0837]